MMQLIATDNVSLIIGGGLTGLSVARYFERVGQRYRVWDTREDIELLNPFKQLNPALECFSGMFTESLYVGINQIILSPGISRAEPFIKQALEQGIPVLGDISLFMKSVDAPVVGITGSNGKSTVTTMVGLVAERVGMHVAVGGNIGVPALDLLEQRAELYVLELSSFQLESLDNAGLTVSANLNLSPDHLDRHGSMQAYFQAKQKIFHRAQCVIYNINDALTQPPIVSGVKRIGFGLHAQIEKNELQFSYCTETERLMMGNEPIMAKSDIKQMGLHSVNNVLATCAIAHAIDIPLNAAVQIAREFPGLPHRCEWVGSVNGVRFINDSKATNVGAARAALEGFSKETEGLIWVAGGEAKGASFVELVDGIVGFVKHCVLIGRDAELIANTISGRVPVTFAKTMEEAVDVAIKVAKGGDIVLFSPACASFDMFRNFEHRGDCFKQAIEASAA